jgi:hypothetical protein
VIFPNPVADWIQFVIDLPTNEIRWSLVNEMGTVMKSGNEKNIFKGTYTKQLDVSNLKQGIYLLTVSSGMTRTSSKIMIVR